MALSISMTTSALQQSDVKSRLRDAINDHVQASGKSHKDDEYLDHDGDGSEGNVVYCCKGDVRQAPYEIAQRGGKSTTSIDMDNSKNVVPHTQYIPEADDDDHYTSMDEAARDFQEFSEQIREWIGAKIYTSVPLYERYISQKTRKGMDSGSFAGKGRSFPIAKPEDVSAALHSIGRAGPGNYNSDTLRANIKRIAKAKGFALPDSLKDDSDKESARETIESVLIKFAVESLRGVELKEASEYPVKLMSPGRGSSGYYPPEVVKRDGPQIFKSGTQMFWNHSTDTEEAERPEGDLNNLAAVLTTDAKYDEAGKDGPGLYASAKVFKPYVDKVQEMGKHIGLSIRAGGSRDEAATGPDGKKGVITALKNAHSVDFVTKAGRDGKIFTEAARATEGADDMDVKEVQRLIEAAVNPLKEENRQLKEMLSATGAPQIIHEALEPIRLPNASKRKIFEKLSAPSVRSLLPLKEGKLDSEAIGKLVEQEAVKEANFLMELGYGDRIASLGKPVTEKEQKTAVKESSERYEGAMADLAEIFVGPKLAGLPKGDPAREARKAARKGFIEGRGR